MAQALDQKVFNSSIEPALIAICPTMDLVAAVTAPDQLEVFRFDGHRAFGVKRGGSDKISALQWRPDGSFILLAWSNGTVQVVDPKLGKVALEYETQDKSDPQPSNGQSRFLGLGMNMLDTTKSKVRIKSKQSARKSTSVPEPGQEEQLWGPNGDGSSSNAGNGQPTLEDFTSRVVDHHLFDKEVEVADLPRRLAQVTIEDQLPRLSALPHGDDSILFNYAPEVFASQERLDELLKPYEAAGTADTVDICIVQTPSGHFNFHIYGDFFAGKVNPNDSTESTVLAHSTNPFTTVHALLVRSPSGQQGLRLIDMQSISSSRHFLPLVCRQIASLKTTTQYITQTTLTMRNAWKACQDLPTRWLEIAEEDVQSQHSNSVISALYALAVTGDALPALREWLVHTIGDRNYKRWEQGTATNYQLIIDLLHRHLVPALDHATVRASRLRALARTPNIPIFSTDERHLTRIINDLDILRLVAHRLLLHARLEARQFLTFSVWLKHMISMQAAEPRSQTAEDAAEKAANTDYALLLQYITEALTRSRVNFFLGRDTKQILGAPRRPAQQSKVSMLAQVLDRQAEKLIQPGTGDLPEIANVLYQCCFLMDSVEEVVRVVPGGFARGVKVGDVVWTKDGAGSVQGSEDVRVLIDDDGEPRVYTFGFMGNGVRVEKYTIRSGKAESERTSVFDAQKGWKLVDLKVLDDFEFVVLMQKGDESRLDSYNFRAEEDKSSTTVIELKHEELGWVPKTAKVSKEKLKVRICFVSEDGKRYGLARWTDWPGQ